MYQSLNCSFNERFACTINLLHLVVYSIFLVVIIFYIKYNVERYTDMYITSTLKNFLN